MADRVVLLSIPQLRHRYVTPGGLASLEALSARGLLVELSPPFPGLAASAFATLMTGLEPRDHGLIGNCFFDRVARHVVSAPLPDSAVHARKLWHLVREEHPDARVLLWFAPNSRGADVELAAWVDAPWQLRTIPDIMTRRLIEQVGPFPDQAASAGGDPPFAAATAWMLHGAGAVIGEERPELSIVRLPYLGQVARRFGPDDREASRAVAEFERMIGPFLRNLPERTAVVAVTESIVTPVTETIYPNRILRQMGLLKLRPLRGGGLGVDLDASAAFALADHQLCHIYLNDPSMAGLVASTFSGDRSEGISLVVASDEQRAMLGLDHPRAGDIVLVACPDSWFAPDWWTNPLEAPAVPSESALPTGATPSVPIDPDHVCGSLGAPIPNETYLGVLICSEPVDWPESADRAASATDVVQVVRRLLS